MLAYDVVGQYRKQSTKYLRPVHELGSDLSSPQAVIHYIQQYTARLVDANLRLVQPLVCVGETTDNLRYLRSRHDAGVPTSHVVAYKTAEEIPTDTTCRGAVIRGDVGESGLRRLRPLCAYNTGRWSEWVCVVSADLQCIRTDAAVDTYTNCSRFFTKYINLLSVASQRTLDPEQIIPGAACRLVFDGGGDADFGSAALYYDRDGRRRVMFRMVVY